MGSAPSRRSVARRPGSLRPTTAAVPGRLVLARLPRLPGSGSTPAATALSVDSQDLEMLALLDREIVRRLRMVS